MTALERLITGDIHRQDEDCIIDPDTNLCISCGVERGDECPACHARSFHRDTCPYTLTISECSSGEDMAVPAENEPLAVSEWAALIYAAVMVALLACACHIAHIL